MTVSLPSSPDESCEDHRVLGQIEHLREQLGKTFGEHGVLNSDEMLRLSRKLDQLILVWLSQSSRTDVASPSPRVGR